MANALITNAMIAKEAIRLSLNKNAFLQNLNRQYDESFARTGAKAGQSIRIRLPVDYTLRTGPTAIVQNTIEQVVNLTVANQFGVDMSFSMVDRTMSLDRFSDRYIKPAINTTVGGQAVSVMAQAEGGVSGWSANQDPITGAILSPNAKAWLNAKAEMENNSVPSDDYKIVMSPNTQANTVDSLKGLFNSQPTVAKQYDNGEMVRALGFDWMSDQTVLLHTTGAYANAPAYTDGLGFACTTVSGAAQTGTSLTVAALAGPLAKGDIIRIAGVQMVNSITKSPTGRSRTFTVTAAVAAGATVIPIYPAITGVDGGGNTVQYQTVNASPANAAQVYVVSAPSSQYRKNLAFVPEAITLAAVDLELPPNVDAAREVFDEISIRIVTQFQIMSDQLVTRLDLLSGSAFLKPEWCVCVPDVP